MKLCDIIKYPQLANETAQLPTRLEITPITEVADQPWPWTQTMRSGQMDKYQWQAADGAIYSAMVAKQYQGSLSGRTLEGIDVGFVRTDPVTGKSSASLTGTGDAFRVFATIRDIVLSYTNSKTPPMYIKFGGKANEPSRVALYRRVAQTIQRWLPGYQLSRQEQGDSHVGFHLQRQGELPESHTKSHAVTEALHFLKPGELRGSYTDAQLRALGFRQSQTGAWYISEPRWQQLTHSGQLRETDQEVTEIKSIPPSGFPGDDLRYRLRQAYRPRFFKELKKINNRLSYRIRQIGPFNRVIEIFWIETNVALAAELRLTRFQAGDLDAWQVDTITVDPDYRKKGLASLLYQLYFREVNPILVSGSMQTPGGQRNWTSLAQNPKIEVTGLLGLDIGFDRNNMPKKAIDAWLEQIMRLGAVYQGLGQVEDGWDLDRVYWFQIPLASKGKVLKATNLQLYHRGQTAPKFQTVRYEMLLLATWRGRQ